MSVGKNNVMFTVVSRAWTARTLRLLWFRERGPKQRYVYYGFVSVDQEKNDVYYGFALALPGRNIFPDGFLPPDASSNCVADSENPKHQRCLGKKQKQGRSKSKSKAKATAKTKANAASKSDSESESEGKCNSNSRSKSYAKAKQQQQQKQKQSERKRHRKIKSKSNQ